MVDESLDDLDDFFRDEGDQRTSKDFALGFIIGTVIVTILFFILFIMQNKYNFVYEYYISILLPIILFVISLILIGGAFKVKRDRIAYGMITAIFSIPMITFLIWFLTYMVGNI